MTTPRVSVRKPIPRHHARVDRTTVHHVRLLRSEGWSYAHITRVVRRSMSVVHRAANAYGGAW